MLIEFFINQYILKHDSNGVTISFKLLAFQWEANTEVKMYVYSQS